MSDGSLITFPKTASSQIHPCELYLDHGSARPAFTQGHHHRPEYLQKRLWGEVRYTELIWLCGTCHDNLHGAIYLKMGEWKLNVPDSAIPLRARALADEAIAWYRQEAA